MAIRTLLWDFGDTLCDERFIWGSGPEWLEVYGTFDNGIGDNGIGDRWSKNELDSEAFSAELATIMDRPAAEIMAHMVDRSTNHIEFFDYTYSYFRARHLPQVIVTVNPDLFSSVIVPAHDLASPCELIVTSWEERTVDKAALCAIAVERLGDQGFDVARSEALLIDNKQDNVAAWIDAGGAGYHYTTDEAFRAAVETGALAITSG